MSLLLAVPSILASIVLTPQIIRLFYSTRFSDAIILLRLQMVGVLLAVVFTPLSYLLLARGKTLLYFLSTVATNLTFVIVAVVGLPHWGLCAAGIAFSLHVALGLAIEYIIVRKLTGFLWFPATKKRALASGMFLLLGLGVEMLGGRGSSITGVVLVLFVSLYCLRELLRLVGSQELPSPLRKLGSFLINLHWRN
jgi:PST family polysaccharide transporter